MDLVENKIRKNSGFVPIRHTSEDLFYKTVECTEHVQVDRVTGEEQNWIPRGSVRNKCTKCIDDGLET